MKHSLKWKKLQVDIMFRIKPEGQSGIIALKRTSDTEMLLITGWEFTEVLHSDALMVYQIY